MTKCLVIDDVTVSRFAVRSFLEELKVDVVEAEDGDKALSMLNLGDIDVIMLDWHLKKKSGIDLLKVIRDKYGDKIKIIVFSGVESGDKKSEVIAVGANGYLSKPTNKEKIEDEFKRVGVDLS